MKRAGLLLLAAVLLAAGAAPVLAPNDPSRSHRGFLFAPPMLPRLVDANGAWHRPFVYPLVLENRLERRYLEDRARRVPLVFFLGGRLVAAADESAGPWLPLGADSSGRDIAARLLYGARTSLGIALLASLAAVLLGAVLGALAGYAGGALDAALMWLAEFVLVLPAVYVVLVLRGALPLVLPAWEIFLLMAFIFGLVGWPWVARGVRGIVAGECTKDYVAAARALGAGHSRVLIRHLLPACRSFLGVQVVLLVPAFILAEATLSFVGLGFPDTIPSWGSMLIDAADVSAIRQFPWTLVPAAGIFLVTLGANLALDTPPLPPVQTRAPASVERAGGWGTRAGTTITR